MPVYRQHRGSGLAARAATLLLASTASAYGDLNITHGNNNLVWTVTETSTRYLPLDQCNAYCGPTGLPIIHPTGKPSFEAKYQWKACETCEEVHLDTPCDGDGCDTYGKYPYRPCDSCELLWLDSPCRKAKCQQAGNGQ